MATNSVNLPEGFVLDQNNSMPAQGMNLPDGFVIDNPSANNGQPTVAPEHQFDGLPFNERPAVTLNPGSHPTYGAPTEPPIMSSFARNLMKNSPVEQARTSDYLNEPGNMPAPLPGENMFAYQKRVQDSLKPREDALAKRGTVSQFDLPIDAGLAISGGVNPVNTGKALGKFFLLDKATNMVGLNPDNIKDPNLRDAASVAKFGAEGALASKGWPLVDKTPEQLLNDYGNIHRDILNPSKGDINNVEIKSKKDIDDYMRLAAKNGLIYNKDAIGKLDTEGARKQLQENVGSLYSQLNGILNSNPEPQFDVEALGEQAKSQLNKTIKNAKDLEDAHKVIDDEVGAEIARNGNMLTGSQLNTFKQGLWGKSYNLLAPNSKDVDRQLGFTAKDAIEKAYPDAEVKDLNEEIGKHLTLSKLLETAHGRVVKAGRLGRYAANILGIAVGHSTHIPGAEILGNSIAGRVSDFMNDPNRISSAVADKVNKLNLPKREFNSGAITPEVVSPANSGFSMNPFDRIADQRAPKPLGLPNIFADRGSTPPPSDVIRMGSTGLEKPTVEGENPNPTKALPPSTTKYGEGFTAKDVPDDIKDIAKDENNQYWYKGLIGKDMPPMSEFNPLKGKGKNLAMVATLGTAGALVNGGQAQASGALKKDKVTDERAINAIIGEAESEGLDGMRAVASAIRNRNSLRGVYGETSKRVVNKMYSPEIYAKAKQAWEDSKTKNYAPGAIGWGSPDDWKIPGWAKDKTPLMKVGTQTFYKRKTK